MKSTQEQLAEHKLIRIKFWKEFRKELKEWVGCLCLAIFIVSVAFAYIGGLKSFFK